MSKDLSDELQKILEDYKDDVTDIVNNSINKASRFAANELKTAGDFKNITGSYRKGWSVKSLPVKRISKITGKVVHNKTDYRLTHLLERGHALRNGGRARAFPHIKNVEEDSINFLIDNVTKELGK